jgi:hypothetical protein
MLTYNSAISIEEQYTPTYKIINSKIQFDYSIENGNIFWIMDECPSKMDGVIKSPKDVVESWRKIINEQALKWLKNNLITYDEWSSEATLSSPQ